MDGFSYTQASVNLRCKCGATGPNNQSWLYVMGEGDRLKAFPFENGKFNVAGIKQGAWIQPNLTSVPQCQTQPNHGMWMPGWLPRHLQ